MDLRLDDIEATLERYIDGSGAESSLEIFPAEDSHRELTIAAPSREVGGLLQQLFNSTWNPEDTNQATEIYNKIFVLTDVENTQKINFLQTIGRGLLRKYLDLGSTVDLEVAISAFRYALYHTTTEYSNLPVILPRLGTCLLSRFQFSGLTSDINEAIDCLQAAVDLTHEDDPCLPENLCALCKSLSERFKVTKDSADMYRAVREQRRAIHLLSCESPNFPMFMTRLGACLIEEFAITNDIETINEAIAIHRNAVNMALQHHLFLPHFICSLSWSLLHRFYNTKKIQDINEAIEVLQNSISLTSEDNSILPYLLDNLGVSFYARFEFRRDAKDLEYAISVRRRALDTTPPMDSTYSSRLSNLAQCYYRRFDAFKELKDLEKCITIQRQLLSLTSLPTANLKILTTMGSCMIERFRVLGNIIDLEESLNIRQKALELMTPNSPDYLMSLVGVADSLIKLFHETKEDNYVRRAHELLKDLRPPSEIIEPIKNLYDFDYVFELLPLMIWLKDTDSLLPHEILKNIIELVKTVVTLAISLGRNDKALMWLEQGRSVVLNQIYIVKLTIQHLLPINQGLAVKFIDLAESLRSGRLKTNGEDLTGQDHYIVKHWRGIIEEIRCFPKLENFMKSIEYEEIKTYVPCNGTVIILHIDGNGCNSLVLKKEYKSSIDSMEVFNIPLSQISYSKALTLKAKLESWKVQNLRGEEQDDSGRSGRLAYNESTLIGGMEVILEELWELIVDPILKALGLKPMENPTDHLWWCPTGPLSFLPIHAAGKYHSDAPLGSILSDYVVSSYITTLISQANTPGMPLIPNTEKEVKNIKNILNESEIDILTLEGETATVEAVSQAISTHSWVHFACHGTQNSSNPLNSAFHVHDGLLTISKIIQVDIQEADFAFLSACETSSVNKEFPDEALHISAAMLNAGYKSVVGSMWSISDACAPDISKELYKCLLEPVNGKCELDSSKAAWALQQSTKKYRNNWKGEGDHAMSWNWVPFVHFGL
ncbi:CHAT domain-containing protein [Cyathus striatus]|nr:CHAT domain-containing protein [Cyathus striatus]